MLRWWLTGRLDAIAAEQRAQRKLMEKIMLDVSNLQAKVERATTVEQSAVTLLQGLKAALDQALASNDTSALQAAVQKMSDDLGSGSDALAAAVAANTPADPSQPDSSPITPRTPN